MKLIVGEWKYVVVRRGPEEVWMIIDGASCSCVFVHLKCQYQ